VEQEIEKYRLIAKKKKIQEEKKERYIDVARKQATERNWEKRKKKERMEGKGRNKIDR